MNSVSFMEKLLDGVEVDWKVLGEVSTLRRGRVMSKGYFIDNAGEYPVYSSQTANNGQIGKIGTFDFDGEFISWTTDGANAGTVFYRTGKFSITNVCGLIRITNGSLNLRFLFYWLTLEAKKHVYSGMGNPKLMSHQVGKIQIPIPCPENPKKSLEIQAEIVRILDTFTELTAELTAELSMRKKQYNYYRDKLLTFEEGAVEWKALGEVCISISSGKNKDKSEGGEFPVYGSTGVIGRTNNKVYEIEQILVARVGANAGRVNIAVGEYDVSDNTLILSVKDNISLKYLFYYLVNLNLNRFVKGAGQPLLTAGQLKAMIIPVPSPDQQARIVSILNKFDALTNSITEGLPREIELRQQQYEYYRDLLLSFPKPEEKVA
jgi:type I restriction enzyme S subunit